MWYQVVLTPDSGTWLVTSPQFEELTTFGETQEEACRNADKAIEEAIAARIADGEDIPVPMADTTGKGWFVQISAMVFLKAALYMLLRSQGKTRADLMRALNCQREHVDRLFRLDHNSKLDSMEAAFEALGEPLRFDMTFPKAA